MRTTERQAESRPLSEPHDELAHARADIPKFPATAYGEYLRRKWIQEHPPESVVTAVPEEVRRPISPRAAPLPRADVSRFTSQCLTALNSTAAILEATEVLGRRERRVFRRLVQLAEDFGNAELFIHDAYRLIGDPIGVPAPGINHALRSLESKKFIDRLETRRGRSGWTKLRIIGLITIPQAKPQTVITNSRANQPSLITIAAPAAIPDDFDNNSQVALNQQDTANSYQTDQNRYIRNARASIDNTSLLDLTTKQQAVIDRMLSTGLDSHPQEAVEILRSGLWEYAKIHGAGKELAERPPDDAIVARVAAIAAPSVIAHTLKAMNAKRVRTGDTYAWFVAVLLNRIHEVKSQDWAAAQEAYRTAKKRKPPVRAEYAWPELEEGESRSMAATGGGR